MEDLVGALHLTGFGQAHADLARCIEALLEQDGFGIGEQSISERVVGPGPGDDPAPLFVWNPFLLSHDAPLSSTGLMRTDWPGPLRGHRILGERQQQAQCRPIPATSPGFEPNSCPSCGHPAQDLLSFLHFSRRSESLWENRIEDLGFQIADS
jgi:hypothetical protein